jgi:hypothetical protein
MFKKHPHYHGIYDNHSISKSEDIYKTIPENPEDDYRVKLAGNQYYGSPIRTPFYRPIHPYFPQSLMTYSYTFEQKLPIYRGRIPPYSSYLTYPQEILIDSKWKNIGYLESKDRTITLKLKAREDLIANELDPYTNHFQYKVINPKGKVDISLHIDKILKNDTIINDTIPGFPNSGPWKVKLN